MASNPIPDSGPGLIALGTVMTNALVELGDDLGITQISAISFQAQLDTFINSENSFNAARSARQTASANWMAATGALYEWLLVARTVLAGRFGARWSTQWAQAGFTGHTTAVPQNAEGQIALAISLAALFAANPTWQVASMNVTAAQANTLRTAALTAQTALTNATQTLKTHETTRDTARTELVGQMRALIKILGATLSREDTRWQVFGLNIPAAHTTPGKPANLTAFLTPDGNVQVQCDVVSLAQRYRWRMRIVDEQPNYILAARSVAPVAVIKTVSPGQAVEIIVQAVNGGSQGVASEPLVYTRPVLVALTPESRGLEAAAPHPMPHSVRPGNGKPMRSR